MHSHMHQAKDFWESLEVNNILWQLHIHDTGMVFWPYNHVGSSQQKPYPASFGTTLEAFWAWGSSGQEGGSGKYSHLLHWVGMPRYDPSRTWSGKKKKKKNSNYKPIRKWK